MLAAPARPSARDVEQGDFLWGGVSGIAPNDLADGRFDDASSADAEGHADAQGPGGDDLVAIDGPPEDAESAANVEMTNT